MKRKPTKAARKKVSKKPLPRRRLSNRVYPPIKCQKTDCTIIFHPDSKKRKYCCPQHQHDQNNDNRDARAAPGIRLEKMYQHNQRVLKKLKEACDRLNMPCISIDYLSIEYFYHDYFTHTTTNSETGKTISWAYFFGLEIYNKEANTFIIHFRQNY